MEPENTTNNSQQFEVVPLFHDDPVTNGAEMTDYGIIESFSDNETEIEFLPHNEILIQLIEQLEPVDFMALVHKGREGLIEKLQSLDRESDEAKDCIRSLDRMKLGRKHYLVLSVEKVFEAAKMNRWDLC